MMKQLGFCGSFPHRPTQSELGKKKKKKNHDHTTARSFIF